jgi:hypothetical protein
VAPSGITNVFSHPQIYPTPAGLYCLFVAGD